MKLRGQEAKCKAYENIYLMERIIILQTSWIERKENQRLRQYTGYQGEDNKVLVK